jgi:hypothetical protein
MYTHVAEEALTGGFEVRDESVGLTHLRELITRETVRCPFCGYVNRVHYVDGRFACSGTCKHRIASDSHPSPTQAQHTWVFAPVEYVQWGGVAPDPYEHDPLADPSLSSLYVSRGGEA